jgi:hypothetical protein
MEPTNKETHMNTQEFRGSKFEQSRNIKDIAKDVRRDIKAAVKAGALRDGKFSVTIDRFSMGQSLDVRVKAVPGMVVVNPERVRRGPGHPGTEYLHTPEAMEMLSTLTGIVNQYHRDGSDIQSDYFDVNFYHSEKFDWEMEAAQQAWIEGLPVAMAVRSKVAV